MTDAGALLLLNALLLVLGVGVAALLGLARSTPSLLGSLGLAYMLGVAAGGILLAHAALADLVPGLAGVALLAAAAVALAALTGRLVLPGAHRQRIGAGDVVGAVALASVAAPLLYAARAWIERPLLEWDGWAIWALKARAIHDYGGADNPILHSPAYAPFHLDYPLLLPALEANGFAAMGDFRGTTIHLQLALLGLGFAAALWGLLRARVPPALAGLTVAAIVLSPVLVPQLSTNYADVPLAFFVALGLLALVLWADGGGPTWLAAAAVFLAAAALTKNEGALFAVAGLLAAFAAVGSRDGARLRGLGAAALAVAAIVAPWRIYAAAHDLRDEVYSFGSLVDPVYLADRRERLGPTIEALIRQAGPDVWGMALPLFLVGIAGATLSRRSDLVRFGLVWAVVSFAGLVAVYWISNLPIGGHLRFSADRTVASLMIGSAAIAPLLVCDAWREGAGAATRTLLRRPS